MTGAGTGIGRACAIAFAREGAKVALVGRRKERLEETAHQIGDGALVLAADITQASKIKSVIDSTVSQFGGLHVLLNNAGLLVPGTAETLSEQEWDAMFNVNVRSLWLLSRGALPHMRAAGGGSVINISSILGLVGMKNRSGYSATKGAVTLLTKCMAVDHAADKIRVNCICPAYVETELTAAAIAKTPDPQAFRRERIAAHPVGRLGQPQDVAGMAVYLASDESSWVTGAAMAVDGGYTAV